MGRARPRRQPVARERQPEFDTQRNDPIPSLSLWGVDVIIDGHAFSIPPRSASMWIEAVLTDDISILLDDDGQWVLDDLVTDGEVSDEAVKLAFRDALVEVGGRPWYVTARLVGLLTEDQVRGEITMKVELGKLPLAAALDVIYAVIVKNMEPKKRAEFERNLAAEATLLGSDPRTAVQRMRERSHQQAQAIGKPFAVSPSRTPKWPPTPRQDVESAEPTPQ